MSYRVMSGGNLLWVIVTSGGNLFGILCGAEVILIGCGANGGNLLWVIVW